MTTRRLILPVSAVVLVAIVAYWSLWKFYYKDRLVTADPFASESTYDEFLDLVFEPLSNIEQARFERRARQTAFQTSQGSWEGGSFLGGEVTELMLTIDGDHLVFTKADYWPALDGKMFDLHEDEEGRGGYYILTDIGRLQVEPPSRSSDVEELSERLTISTSSFSPVFSDLPRRPMDGIRLERVEH